MHPLLNTGFKAARRASQIILKQLDRLDELTISEKATNNYVTDVDKQAEQALVSVISEAYPDHTILAEESGLHEAKGEVTWIIDPLDGTNNYLHGFQHFCISLGVKVKDQLTHGLIYDPIREELFTASKGAGATLNDKRIRVSKQAEFKHALLATGFPHRRKDDLLRDMTLLAKLYQHVSDVRIAGSAALDLAYVAAGRLEGYWEFGLEAWDLAAGALLVKEAGGYVSDTDGSDNFLKSGNIIAANPKVFELITKHLNS